MQVVLEMFSGLLAYSDKHEEGKLVCVCVCVCVCVQQCTQYM